MHYKPFAAAWIFVWSFVTPSVSAQQEKLEPSRLEIEKIVREYILQHPEVIAQAANLYQERERAARQTRTKDAVTAKLTELEQDPSSPVTGAVTGITMVEFFDYHCGYCKRTEPVIEKLLADHPDIKFVFKEFPILGPESLLAAQAGLAAQKQGGYLKFHQALLSLTGPITNETLERLAIQQGLNVAKLKADMISPETKAILDKNAQLASQLGITATPSFVVGTQFAQGALTAAMFEQLITQARPIPLHSATATVDKSSNLSQ